MDEDRSGPETADWADSPQASSPSAAQTILLDPLLLRFPRGGSDLFRLLALAGSPTALDGVLASVDFGAATLPLIYRLVHRRPPESIDALADGAGTDLAQHFAAALLSDEFQERVLTHLLTAFSHRRDFLLVVDGPAENRTGLAPRGFLPLDPKLAVPSVTDKATLFETLARIVPLLAHVEGVFLPVGARFGHLLKELPQRPSDRVSIILDDPRTILVRQANDAIATIMADPEGHGAAARLILGRLELDSLPARSPIDSLRSLALRALQDPEICPLNPICRQLSMEETADYRAAITSAAIHDVELVDTTSLSAWCAATSRHGATPQLHQLAPILTTETASAALGDWLDRVSEQDRMLREVVLWGLQRRQAASIRGSQLVDDAGHRLVEGLPRQLMRREASPLPDVVVASGPQAALDYLEGHVPAAEFATSLLFGVGGSAEPALVRGWSGAEPGYVWTNGFRAELCLPRPAQPIDHVLRIHASPYVLEGSRPFQTVDIALNDRPLASARLTDQAVMSLVLPWSQIADRDNMAIALDLPLATRPVDVGDGSDTRRLALCVRRVDLFPAIEAEVMPSGVGPPKPTSQATADRGLAQSDREVVAQFESLGENCEFGLVQRGCGAEPLGLLRFSSAPLPKLVAALAARFEDIGRADLIEVQVSENGKEYMVLDLCYGFFYHAWAFTTEKTAEEVHRRECSRVPFLARKLIEDLTGGEKIFVFHGMSPLRHSEAVRLASLIRSYGPSTLLWVELADASHPPGSVERLGPGLLKGYMDRFAPGDNAYDLSMECWLKLCRTALDVRNRS